MMVWAQPGAVKPNHGSTHTAARQAIRARTGRLAPWLLVEFLVPLLCFSVFMVCYLSSALRACSAAEKSQRHDPVAPSRRFPAAGGASRAEARQPKLHRIDSTVCSCLVS